MEIQEEITAKRSFRNTLHRIPERISEGVEHFFYRLGVKIAQHPKAWLLGCTLMILLCLSGLYFFRQEKNPLKLWVPPDSDFVKDTEWLMSSYDEGLRVQSMILTAHDVLVPEVLIKLNKITKEVLSVQTLGKPKITWTDVCFKVPVISGYIHRHKRNINDLTSDFFDKEPGIEINETQFNYATLTQSNIYCKILNSLPQACLFLSILDIWEYNSSRIEKQTKEDIVTMLNTIDVSPTLGHPINYTEFLGDITKDEKGRIVSAKAVKTQWLTRVNFSNINMDKMGNDAGTADWATDDVLRWESAFLEILEKNSNDLKKSLNGEPLINIWYEAGRSFGDVSATTIFQDIDKLAIGIFLMFVYIQVILSDYNYVEWRLYLTVTGLLCVGGAFIISVGLCSLFHVPYGPVHTSLPFMLLGLGVDDVFVMMASWRQIHTVKEYRERSLPERVGLALGHAGSAISITSLTDVVAFIIGASTILPCLQSFCIYAAVGVLVTFLLQITFFVGFFTLDAKRIEKRMNSIIPCIVHENFVPGKADVNGSFSSKLINFLYSKVVFTKFGKIFILLVTIVIAIFGIIGSCQLEQWFDPAWFLPKGSYLSDYRLAQRKHFSHQGFSATVFIGEINYSNEFRKIVTMNDRLSNLSSVESIQSWPRAFTDFTDKFFKKDLTMANISYNEFQYYLSHFLHTPFGGKYQRNFRFDGNLTCGNNAPKILISSIDFSFRSFSGPHEWIPGMDDTKVIAKEAGIDGFVTVWSKMFGTWVTDKLISQEVLRNLTLALVCVMGTTVVLIVEPQTCFWILVCVLLTLLDVCGLMYYWGLTIDIVSCIGLELAVGLSVDYAAHVAHAFLNTPSSNGNENRERRALIAVRHIGAAVAYGAGSTLLALSMLSLSTAYVFRAFFKIFLLVILIGLWHGLFLLPVVLSVVGPRSLRLRKMTETVDNVYEVDNETVKPLKKDTDNS